MMLFTLIVIVLVGGIVLGFPITRRLFDLLGARAENQGSNPLATGDTQGLRDVLETLDKRLAVMEERQDFMERLLEAVSFEATELEDRNVKVDADYVNEHLGALVDAGVGKGCRLECKTNALDTLIFNAKVWWQSRFNRKSNKLDYEDFDNPPSTTATLAKQAYKDNWIFYAAKEALWKGYTSAQFDKIKAGCGGAP